MPNYSNADVESALLDVRKAYRLLHAYQTRVLDLVKYISKRMGLNFRSGWPWYTDNYQKGGRVDLDNWSFDWLYMYLYEFNLLDQREETTGLAFSVVIIPDTGFFDKGMLWSDRNLVGLFNPVEQSQSRILFMVGKRQWHPGPERMQHLFKRNSEPYAAIEDGKIFLAKSYLLTDFMNAEQADNCINDFVSFCQEKGIYDFSPVA